VIMTDYSDETKDIAPLEERGIYLFSGEVNEERCEGAIRWIIEENFEARHPMLTLLINSPGGCLNSGFSLIDVMAGSTIPIRTVGLGIIASMGLLMFIAGKKGERILTPNTLIMSHQWHSWVDGKEHELIAYAKHNNLISEMVMRHYRKHTRLSTAKIKKYLLPPSDIYLDAIEAKGLGICDQIRLM
jgi:ATP-dependent Clp protease protease subunit